MAVTQRLELRQSQTLVMTPQLRQAIQLLQYSSLELNTFVDQQLVENPLLERDETQAGEADPREAEGAASEASGDDYSEGEAVPDSLDQLASGEFSEDSDRPLDSEPVYDDNSPSDGESSLDWGHRGAGGDGEGGERSIEEAADETPDLRSHLLQQMPVEISAPAERMIAAYLIDQVDPSGYLTIDMAALADQLGLSEERLEALRLRLQCLEPTGVFARDLAECLALQLKERNRFDPCMAALLENLALLAEGKLAQLRALCQVDEEDFAEMLAEIRALDPKPGLQFDLPAAEAIIPDVLMRARPDGSWLIELNPDAMPRLLVNRNYYAAVVSRCRDRAERNYLTEQLGAASWLVKSLHQRATTIIKVASEIVRQQEDFFRKGVAHMRPLTLRDVAMAEEVSLHESTVSRVTANKYIATPRGIFELKYFFSTAVGGEGEDAHAAESIRHRIRSLIDAETADRILSDDALVKQLRQEGIAVARRTVAKYRETMRIPSSVERRRLKAARNGDLRT